MDIRDLLCGLADLVDKNRRGCWTTHTETMTDSSRHRLSTHPNSQTLPATSATNTSSLFCSAGSRSGDGSRESDSRRSFASAGAQAIGGGGSPQVTTIVGFKLPSREECLRLFKYTGWCDRSRKCEL